MPPENNGSQRENKSKANLPKRLQTKRRASANSSVKPHAEVNFPVVGVGASAGGLEAFTKLLNQIPQNSGIAFVIVQHLDPTHTSSLPELLSRQSAIPVLEAANGTVLEPDHIYVIPSGKSMFVHNRQLSLIEQPIPGLTHSVDIFFKSLADDVKDQAIGVILSGTGSDGVEGARAIKSQHGMMIVQQPDTAKYDGMPRAAIDAGVQDKILPPETIIKHIIGFVNNSGFKANLDEEPKEHEIDKIDEILSLIKARTRHDFSGYKVASINRRIKRRMNVNQIVNLKDYFNFILEHPEEIDSLINDFLINVTSFFRDARAFESLKQHLCTFVKNKSEGAEIRVWVPGCASGEEAYSVAMLLVECSQEANKNLHIQVFGTDLDAEAIASARIGDYPLSIASDVGEARLKQFFNKYNNSYKVKKDLRDRMIFAVHDLIRDAPYSRMDIVSLRNVMIYLNQRVQKKILAQLHYSLNKEGLLFLGTAETIGEATNLFAVVDRKWRIYRCINKDKLPLGRLPDDFSLREKVAVDLSENVTQGQPGTKYPNSFEHLLLEALPPAVLIDNLYQVIFTHGNTGKYLQLPEGKPVTSVLQMVNQNMRTILSTALRKAAESKQSTSRMGPISDQNSHDNSVKITALPLSKTPGNFVITFQDVAKPTGSRTNKQPEFGASTRDLELELRDARESLRSTVEEMETANEELTTSNEEFQSTNEELQSANEELESSREELQSTNEELETINTQHQKKIEQLDTINDDMNNLLNSTNIATVFLDEQLKILRFTPAITALFNFVDTDKGRPINHITSHLKSGTLLQSAHQVLQDLIPVEQTVETDSGKWFSMRIFPYRTTDNTIAGVIVSFVDVNKEKLALTYAQSIIDTVREAIIVLDEGLQIISANKSFYKTFHFTTKKIQGQHIFKLEKGRWDVPELRKLLQNILSEDKLFNDFRLEYKFSDTGSRVMLLNARRIQDELGSNKRILLAMEDITGRSELPAKAIEGSSTQAKEKGKLERKRGR